MILKNLKKTLFVLVLIYAVLGAYYVLRSIAGGGDEILFIKDLELIKTSGWIEAIKKNISIPHMLIVSPFATFLKSHVALRLVNVLLLLGLYLYFHFRNKPTLSFYMYLTFYVGTAKVFFIGTNDSLFIVGLVIFLNEVYKLTKENNWKGGLALAALVVSFFTRQLFFVYLPIILYGLYLVYKHKGVTKKVLPIPMLLIAFFLLCNMPSIQTNGKLSYDLKSPPKSLSVTWSQRQNLAQVMVNEGKLKNYKHPTFTQTQAYIDEHGENSLPRTTLESILFDPALTIKEFFKDFYYMCYYGFRQLSLMIFISLFFLIRNVVKAKKITSEMFLPLALFIMLCVFSLIIISYVELRWLLPIFIMTIVYYSDLERGNKISKKLISANHIALFLLVIYGGARLIPKLL